MRAGSTGRGVARMNTLRAVWRSRSARLVGALAVIASVVTWAAAGPATSQSIAASTSGVGVEAQARTYYIAADEVVWDYAPAGTDLITGKPFGDRENTYVQSGPGRIGSKYLKCLYRGYTDGSFDTLQPRPASEAYLGYLGPVIRAQVGDTIKVVFRNRCQFPTSIHPHGVLYDKGGEGAPYSDGTSGAAKDDDGVPTGGTYTYNWSVPERAGPGPMEGSSVMWMYHSHTREVADSYSGLMGMMVVTRKGMARADGSPVDVDR